LTEFEPVMFPTAESAYLEPRAAVTEAKVSGREVPRATRVIAVTELGMPKTQPSKLANSWTTTVIRAMKISEPAKAAQPLHIEGGGTQAKSSFQPIDKKCMRASNPSTSSTSELSESKEGPKISATLNYLAHDMLRDSIK